MTPDLHNLLTVCDAYTAATGLVPSTVSKRFLGSGLRIAKIRAGGDMGSLTIARAIRAFDAAWPADAPWPAAVPRPSLTAAPTPAAAPGAAGLTPPNGSAAPSSFAEVSA